MHEKGGKRTNVLNLRIVTLVSPSTTSYLGTSMDQEVSCLPLVTGKLVKTPSLLTIYGAWDRNKESSLIMTMFYFCSCFVCVSRREHSRPCTLQISSPSDVNLVAKAGQRG